MKKKLEKRKFNLFETDKATDNQLLHFISTLSLFNTNTKNNLFCETITKLVKVFCNSMEIEFPIICFNADSDYFMDQTIFLQANDSIDDMVIFVMFHELAHYFSDYIRDRELKVRDKPHDIYFINSLKFILQFFSVYGFKFSSGDICEYDNITHELIKEGIITE